MHITFTVNSRRKYQTAVSFAPSLHRENNTKRQTKNDKREFYPKDREIYECFGICSK